MIAGRYFDGRNSGAIETRLEIGRDGVVRVHGLATSFEAPLATVEISDRVGNIPRRIIFADRSAFETRDNDAIDAALATAGHGGFERHVARWERRWPIAVGALLAVGIISWLFVRYGLPALATGVAHTLPPAADHAIGIQGLELLDRTLLAPSKLPPNRQNELRARFEKMTTPLADGHDYRLVFRRGRAVGPNAFALPSGIVVMTDELVALAKHDDELVAVLAHEVGHVRGRHALRMLLQSAGVAAISLAVLGDVSSASALAAAIPTTLVHAKHSRDFEREADEFSRHWLNEQGIAPRHFDGILCRMEAKVQGKAGAGVAGESGGARRALDYWSSHPSTAERAACSQTQPES